MSSRALALLAIVLAAPVVALAVFWKPAPQTPAGAAGGDFVLQSADGPVDTAKLRGKLVLVYFGYTYCPDICPTSLSTTSQALETLTPVERAQVKLVFVSVDPERDTPARLKDYAAFFHANITGVTGSKDEIAAVARMFGASYARQETGSAAGYVMDHSAWTYVVAPDGRLVERIAHGATVEQTVAAIRKWLPATPATKGNS